MMETHMNIQTTLSALSETRDAAPQLGRLILLEEGLIGCEAWRRFMLDSAPEAAPMMLMRSLDEPDLSFIAVDPRAVMPDYRLELSGADLAALGSPSQTDLAAIVIINTGRREGLTAPTANLLGPVAINLATGAARQVIQPEYSAHYAIGQ